MSARLVAEVAPSKTAPKTALRRWFQARVALRRIEQRILDHYDTHTDEHGRPAPCRHPRLHFAKCDEGRRLMVERGAIRARLRLAEIALEASCTKSKGAVGR